MSDPIRSLDLDLEFDPESGESGVSVCVCSEPPMHVVCLAGELDLTTRAIVRDVCTSPDHRDVIVDLSGLTFMDCAGYGALAAARTDLERRGGSLVLAEAVGEPRRLLALIEQLERGGDDSLTPIASASWAPGSCATSTRTGAPSRIDAITPNEEHS